MTGEPAGVTMTAEPPTLWTAQPGWGIAADLIPPELINARQLKVLRKLMAAGLVVLLVICAAGYYLAVRESARASSDLGSVEFETTQLQAGARSYSGVIAVQGSISQIEFQVAQVMGSDVDLVGLMVSLQSSLPTTMTITQEAISISSGAAAGASSAPSSADARIGTITMTGTGRKLNDLSDYIDHLNAIPGLVDVLPVSNTMSAVAKSGTQFSLTIGLTNRLFTHRFDVGGR